MDTEPQNVFIRLYAHRPQRHRTPRENFVTEAFAIVLSMQRKVLDRFFRLLGEEDIPNDLRVDTQIPVDGSCFDITVSNDKDFYFLIECKLEAAFGGASDEQSDQLHRYAKEVRRSPARRKGLITVTLRIPPARDLGDVRLLTARWADVLELCAVHGTSGQDFAATLTNQFAALLRFLKVDRGLHSNDRLLWRCELCGFETTGQGIHSHRDKHRREYAHLIDRENQRLRDEFERELAPYSRAIATAVRNAQALNKIEMGNYNDCREITALFEDAEIPRSHWLYVMSLIRGSFSNRAYESFCRDLAELPGVGVILQPQYVSNTYENILAAIAGSKNKQPQAQTGAAQL